MHYDLIIIGAGPGGYKLAALASEQGLKTLVFERKALGGTCLNRGCIPTKTYLAVTDLLRKQRDFAGCGLEGAALQLRWNELVSYKNTVVSNLQSQIGSLFQATGVEWIQGEAQVIAPGKVQCGETVYEAERIVLAAGGQTAIPSPFLPAYEASDRIVTSDELLAEEAGEQFPDGLPQSVAIIGGGVIGVEFADLFANLQIPVTIYEALPRILANLDEELSKQVERTLKPRSVKVRKSVSVTRLQPLEGGKVQLSFAKAAGGEEQSETYDLVLLATGRRCKGETLFAETCKPDLERGAVVCNAQFESSIPGIYAIGDLRAGSSQLAHGAEAEAKLLLSQWLGRPSSVRLDCIPAAVYCQPEVASCGLTQLQAQEQGRSVEVRKILTRSNAKTLLERSDRGLIQIVYDAQSHQILGAQLFCDRASDLIGEISLAISRNLKMEDLASTIHCHPSYSEMLGDVSEPFCLG